HAEAHGLAGLDRAGVRLDAPGDEAEQGGLARAVDAHDADAVVARQGIGKVADDRLVPVRLADVRKLDGLAPKPPGQGADLHPLARGRRFLVAQGLVPLDAVAALGAAGARAAHDP